MYARKTTAQQSLQTQKMSASAFLVLSALFALQGCSVEEELFIARESIKVIEDIEHEIELDKK